MDTQDVQRWMVRLLGLYSEAYANSQYRALQQFFRWAGRSKRSFPTPWRGYGRRRWGREVVPVFTSVELTKLEQDVPG